MYWSVENANAAHTLLDVTPVNWNEKSTVSELAVQVKQKLFGHQFETVDGATVDVDIGVIVVPLKRNILSLEYWMLCTCGLS